MLTRVKSSLPPDVEDVMFRVSGAAVAFEFERRLKIVYKGAVLQGQKLDVIVEAKVIVEVKAVSQLEEIHGSQLVSYLRSTGLRAGLLINFNSVVLRLESAG